MKCVPGCRCECDQMCGCHDQLHPWLEPMHAQTLADIADLEMDEALDVANQDSQVVTIEIEPKWGPFGRKETTT